MKFDSEIYLVDTNVLLRFADRNHSLHRTIRLFRNWYANVRGGTFLLLLLL